MSLLKHTALRDFHIEHGGRLVDFAGWEMPVQYESILEEHKAVRRAAGLFDVSHMGEIRVSGAGAGRFLNRLLTNDLSRMEPGRVVYSPMCDPTGGVIDDLLVYMRSHEQYLLCVNASNAARDYEWIAARAKDSAVEVVDCCDEYALLAIQGPRAAAILQTLTSAQLADIHYYHFVEASVAGIPCLLSRTGYTGEDGFELYHAPEAAPRLAGALLEAGRAEGLKLCGLGARDSLRLEAGYPLYGHELSGQISPLAAGLGWTVKFAKPDDFIGREALLGESGQGVPKRVHFFRTGSRRIVRADAPVMDETGKILGRVLSGTLSPILNEGIGSMLLEGAPESAKLQVDLRGTLLDLQRVKAPFVPLPKRY